MFPSLTQLAQFKIPNRKLIPPTQWLGFTTFNLCSTTPQICMAFEIHIMWPKENETLLLSLRDIIYCKDCVPGSEDRYSCDFNWIFRLESNAFKWKWFAWSQGDHKSWMRNDSLHFKCHKNFVIFILQLCNWV